MAEAVTAAIEIDADLLSAGELAQIRGALERLDAAASGSERRAIMLALDSINKITEPFASRRMDRTIHRALSGKKLDDMKI